MLAAHEGHTRIVRFLVERGADVSQVDEYGDNVLHFACRGGDMDMVIYVVTQYITDINSKGMYGSTPLLQAAYCGHSDVLRLLASSGANLSHVDDDGENILHFACRGGHVGIVRYILTIYSVGIINSRDNYGETPLMKAALDGHRYLFELLMRNGAEVKCVDDKGDNILHHASIGGHASMVKHILSHVTLDINSRGKNRRTPLMRSACYGHRKVFDLLVSKGALTHLVDNQGNNILHLAAFNGQVRMVKHILSQNIVDINSKRNKGATPLNLAAFRGHKDVYELLLIKGANGSLTDDDGDSVLHYASGGGQVEIIQCILSQELVDINRRGKYGRTALMTAAYLGHIKVLDLLVSKGAPTQSVDDQGNTILHLASLGGRVVMVRHILSKNMADLNAKNTNGETAGMTAMRNGKSVIFSILKSSRIKDMLPIKR